MFWFDPLGVMQAWRDTMNAQASFFQAQAKVMQQQAKMNSNLLHMMGDCDCDEREEEEPVKHKHECSESCTGECLTLNDETWKTLFPNVTLPRRS